jgi:hypothetical protein
MEIATSDSSTIPTRHIQDLHLPIENLPVATQQYLTNENKVITCKGERASKSITKTEEQFIKDSGETLLQTE